MDATEAVLTMTDGLVANYGLDLEFDITHPMTGYEGFTTWDEELEAFVLNDDDDPSTWPGGFTTWSGGFTTWSGGFTTWSGGFTTWSGSLPGDSPMAGGRSPALTIQDHQPLPWAGRYTLEWLQNYADGEPAPVDSPISIDQWVEEVDWASPYNFIPIITSN